MALASPRRVLAAGLLLAVCGWVASTGTGVETDIRDLAPPNLKALDDLNELEKETGISGDVNVTIRAKDPTDPAVISWAEDFQQRVLARHGFSGANPSCADADICPALSLTDFFGGASSSSSTATSPQQSVGDVHALVQALPCFISQIVISHRGECSSSGGTPIGDTADVAFGIRAQPLSDQQDLIDDIRAQIDPPGGPAPPEGTTVRAGRTAGPRGRGEHRPLPQPLVAAAGRPDRGRHRPDRHLPLGAARDRPSDPGADGDRLVGPGGGRAGRRAQPDVGDARCARDRDRHRVQRDPLSALRRLSAARGLSVGEALRRTYLRTGAAVLASGVTAIAGFAVLAIAGLPLLGDIGLISVAPVLRDFGLVTVVDLLVALAGVMLVLPAAVVWSEEGFRLPWRARPAPLAAGESAP